MRGNTFKSKKCGEAAEQRLWYIAVSDTRILTDRTCRCVPIHMSSSDMSVGEIACLPSASEILRCFSGDGIAGGSETCSDWCVSYRGNVFPLAS